MFTIPVRGDLQRPSRRSPGPPWSASASRAGPGRSLCVELGPAARDPGRLGATPGGTAGPRPRRTRSPREIETFLFHPSFPVDIRHNAKIFREKLAVWAAKAAGDEGPRHRAAAASWAGRSSGSWSSGATRSGAWPGAIIPSSRALGVEPIRGDVADPAAVDRAVEGCDVVFHVAAKAGIWGPYAGVRPGQRRRDAERPRGLPGPGVGRLVFTSSPSVVYGGGDLEGRGRVDPLSRPFRRRLSRRPRPRPSGWSSGRNGPSLATVALRPHLIWGPGDNHLVPRIVARARAGRLRRIGQPAQPGRLDLHRQRGRGPPPRRRPPRRPARRSPAGPTSSRKATPGRSGTWSTASSGPPALPPVTRIDPAGVARLAGAVLEAAHRAPPAPGRAADDPVPRPPALHRPLVQHRRRPPRPRLSPGRLDRGGPPPRSNDWFGEIARPDLRDLVRNLNLMLRTNRLIKAPTRDLRSIRPDLALADRVPIDRSEALRLDPCRSRRGRLLQLGEDASRADHDARSPTWAPSVEPDGIPGACSRGSGFTPPTATGGPGRPGEDQGRPRPPSRPTIKNRGPTLKADAKAIQAAISAITRPSRRPRRP